MSECVRDHTLSLSALSQQGIHEELDPVDAAAVIIRQQGLEEKVPFIVPVHSPKHNVM